MFLFSLQSISDEEVKRSKYMTNVQAVVTALFRTAIAETYPMYSKTKTIVTPSNAERFGDYKCIAAMPIAQVPIITLPANNDIFSY